MWGKMSRASQSKVQESEGYEAALLQRDCVQLWEFVRRTHLTHIYSDRDPMVQIKERRNKEIKEERRLDKVRHSVEWQYLNQVT